MTIKLPEPYSIQMWVSYQGAQLSKTCETNLYTEAQLKQAIRDALEEAACMSELNAEYLLADGYRDDAETKRKTANEIRKLKEQLK